MKLTISSSLLLSALLCPLSALFAEDRESEWIHDLHLNLILNEGNSENLNINTGLSSRYKSGLNEISSSLEYSFGEATVRDSEGVRSEQTTTDRIQAESQVNHLLTERAYALLGLNALKDRIADIQYRTIVGPGLGYFLIREEGHQLSVEAGMAYLMEKVSEETDDYLIFRLAQRYERALGDNAEIWQSLEYLPQAEDFVNYFVNAELGAKARLNGNLGLRMVLQNRYDNTPADSAKRNDLRITAGLTYRF